MRTMRNKKDYLLTLTRRTVINLIGGAGIVTTLGSGATIAQTENREQWRFETGDEIISSPTVVDGTVFIGSNDNNLYAVDADTGDQQWAFEADYRVTTSPTVIDDTVYVGSHDNNVYAIDVETGTEQWSFETPFFVQNGPTVVDEIVYAASRDGNIYAIDAESGDEQWMTEIDSSTRSAPTVVDDTLFIRTSSDTLYALDAQTGTIYWAFDPSDESTGSDFLESSPTVVDGTVFVGFKDGNLYAVDAQTGTQEWTFEINGYPRSSPTVVDGTVYVGGSDLHAVNAETGEQEFIFETIVPVESSPTVADGTVFFGVASSFGSDGLYAVDAETGTEQWMFEIEDAVVSSPTVTDGTVFVGGENGNLYAINAGVEGSSEGSRVLSGTLGHHDERVEYEVGSVETRYTGQENDEDDADERGTLTQFVPGDGAGGSPLLIGGGGVATVGAGYFAYKKIRDGDDETSTGPSQTSSPTNESVTQSAPPTSSVSINNYDELNLGDTVEKYPTTEIRQATTSGHPVWVLTPTGDDGTIDTSQLTQFSAEVEPWTNMDEHEHLLSVYGHGDEPLPWVVVEPADIPSLAEKPDTLTTGELLEILTQACDGVHHVQRYGVAYEQLSPNSVLVADGKATLRGLLDHISTDCSGYKLPTSDEDRTAEQADVYRLGALAYDVLTGASPDQPKPTPPSTQDASLSGGLDEVILKALATNPEERHETVLHLRDELQDCIDTV